MNWLDQGKIVEEEMTPRKRIPYAARGNIEDALANISKVQMSLVVEIDRSDDVGFIKRTLNNNKLLNESILKLQQVTFEREEMRNESYARAVVSW